MSRMRLGRFWLAALLCALPAMLAGCDDGGQLTEVMVVVTSDLDVPADIDAVRVEVSGTSSGPQTSGGSLTDGQPLPRRVGLVHDGGSLGPFTVRAIGLSGGTEVVERSATLSFDPGRTVELELPLERACLGTSCGDGQTCDGGSCVSDAVDSSELPDWEGGLTDGGTPDAGPCPGVAERCNERDDDCDGMVDEDFDLNRDPLNCGACNQRCPSRPNASATCRTGSCGSSCDSGFSDCDGDPSNGCETDLSSPASCGACTNDCRIAGTMVACNAGSCEVVGCESGFDDCNDDPADGCETPLTTLTDCGACGTACMLDNATATCESGSCEVMSCDSGFGDCNDDPTDGCETSLDSLTHCGACDTACALDNATETCSTGSCEVMSCDSGFGDCNSDATDGCELPLDTLTDCGSCGVPCELDNATESCATLSCEIETCESGFDDCNGTAADGCEIDLSSDDANCGTCDNTCGSGTRCVRSDCHANTEVLQIAAGDLHSCAVRVGGDVLCWGAGGDGQLGDGASSPSDTPVAASGLTDALQVGAGDLHGCARRATGEVECWGDNGSGQLGRGTGASSDAPVLVSGLTDAADLGVGALHGCAVRQTGEVVCWGDNGSGQLGNASTGGRETSPVAVSGLGDAVQVDAGGAHSCAVRETGEVACWGDNGSGQLGNASTGGASDVPVAVSGLSDAVVVAAGADHTCALRSTGAVVCWGDNGSGQLGNAGAGATSDVPVDVGTLATAIAVDAGGSHSCAALDDGTARCWGSDADGRLGDGTGDSSGTTPVTVTGLADAVGVAAGGAHSCATQDGGGASCWGLGTSGQLGDGAGASSDAPVSVSIP